MHLLGLSQRFEEQYQFDKKYKSTKRIKYENGLEERF